MTDTSGTTSSTRDMLIDAALYLFGTKGFEATSTRAIADRAGANVASIAYYFGSKAGLRQVCIETVASRIKDVLAPFDRAPWPETPEAARAQMHATLQAFVEFIVGAPAASNFMDFILRELSEPGVVVNYLYNQIVLPRHARYCALWSIATGQPAESEDVKLTVFALIGQVIYFRLAGPVITQRMGWSAFGPKQIKTLTRVLSQSLDASISRNHT